MAQMTTPLASREMPTGARAVLVVTLIYIFLVGVGLLEGGIKVMGADTQAQLFEGVNNPLAGLFVGILGTVLVQSSSASTSVIVGLVASGALGVDAAVPMIMGANIGTTVTNTLVSLGSIRQSEDFKRAFAAATVHDFFNLLAVMILLPFELLTGWLSQAAESISEQLVGAAGSEWKSPVKKWVKEPVNWLRDGYSNLGLEENVLGTIMVVTGIGIVLLALTFITKNMRRLVADRVERSLNAVLGSGGGSVAMLLGMIITISVQSSSITTSIMVPLAAAGVVSIHNIYPVTLGANVGTTITALLAALAASKPEALTIGLVHTLFNVGAIAILYPYKRVREIPIRLAQGLAQIAVTRQAVAIGYVVVMFIVIPLVGVAVFR
ncbi:MAG: Na/Pi symporter [Acidimicrobiales bacterium]|nr:Na/Pi symporter [Acidimicrobiales bacterium]MDG2216490.1 Na/Pi symporter [Acidimicrobiales bacterium]